MKIACSKCGGCTEDGFTTAIGLIGGGGEPQHGQLVFIVQGTPTSPNLLEALRQGISDEPTDRKYRILGRRCVDCKFLELYGESF